MSVKLMSGALAGFAGGIPIGILISLTGGMQRVAVLAGGDSPILGWFLHLAASAVLGVGYALIVGQHDLGRGGHMLAAAGYAAIWWLIGTLTLMPLIQGMPLGWNAGAAMTMLPKLFGLLFYGMSLGWYYERMRGVEGRIQLVKA